MRLKTGLLIVLVLTGSSVAADHESEPLRIPVAEYHDKVYAAWLGQIVGNIYGLSYEFKFIDEPGPDEFPYGYGPSLIRVEEAGGAFSDDDTDIEYMYLLQMEKHGIEPTYAQLADAWKYHVRDRVWIANRAALTLMRAGYGPPVTGNKDYNPHWFQIDPQLVNEIWAVTAPGMLDYAASKSAWAARITNDDFGIEPTIHYAAMYSAAFFESDIGRLIDIGSAALPPGSRFATTVEHMKQLHERYPDDWQRARAEMTDRYYGTFDYNQLSWPPADANLNGACAILALLYGSGDFQRTLDIASGLGFDADNQAATMSGLLGIINGIEGIPEDLLFPLGKDEWRMPFNDYYKNVSRHDLPDASLSDMATRTAEIGAKVILANGGDVVRENGVDYYDINSSARFVAPFELTAAPTLLAERGKPFSFAFFDDHGAVNASFNVVQGGFPAGLTLVGNRISGTPTTIGDYPVRIEGALQGQLTNRDYVIRVLGENLAQSATSIIHNEDVATGTLEIIRDGDSRGTTFYSEGNELESQIDFFGYTWGEAITISSLVFNPGLPQEFGGWFTSLDVQYLDTAGEWRSIENLAIEPEINLDNSQWLKGSYIDHTLTFDSVTTAAIRIAGYAGGIEPDSHTGESTRYFLAIAELAVYGE